MDLSISKKIKNILSKRTHWRLAGKAAIFAIVWFIAPWWFFLFVALYCYFIPFFQPWKLFAPFFCLMALTVIQPPNFLFAIVFGVAFYYILLIKDFLIINRRFAYEILALGLSFFLIRDFFRGFDGPNGSALLWSLGLAIMMGLLMNSMMRFFKADVPVPSPFASLTSADSPEINFNKKRLRIFSVWLITLLSWQLFLAGLFLPLDFVYQSTIAFVAVTFFYELIAGYFFSDLSREKIFVTASVFLSLVVILLSSASWKL